MAGRVTSFNVQGEDYRVEADLQFDSTPTAGSTNPVTSNGIFDAIKGAAIGDDISIGRIAGSNIGYRSVVYGVDSVATGSYSIVFGYNNMSFSHDGSLISGSNNMDCGTGQNLTLGNSNFNRGCYSAVLGDRNRNGQALQPPLSTDSPYRRPDVYIGYVSFANKKIYHDENLRNEIILNPRQDSYGKDAYFIDCTSTKEGKVYLLKYAYNSVSRKWVRNSLTEIGDNAYVDITDVSHSATYNYKGVAYYDSSTDKLYSNAGMTNLIRYSYGSMQMYLDLNNNLLIRQNIRDQRSQGYNVSNDWVHFLPHKGYNANSDSAYGRCAYVQEYSLEVYSNPDLTTNITDQIMDGELVIDYNSADIRRYYFDDAHRLVAVSENLNAQNQTNSLFICGHENFMSTLYNGGYGSAIVGEGNSIVGPSMYTLISGRGNSLVSYNNDGGNGVILGKENSATVGRSAGRREPKIIGDQNSLQVSTSSDTDVIIGGDNSLGGVRSQQTVISGGNNSSFVIYQSIVSGQANTSNNIYRSCIIGVENQINKEVYFNGSRSEPINVSPDAFGNMPSSYQTNRLYRVFKRVSTDSGYAKLYGPFNTYAYSSDGSTLTNLSSGTSSDQSLFVFGSWNKLIRPFESYAGSQSPTNECMIIGHQNTLISSSTAGVTLLGYGLTYQGSTNAAKAGVSTVFAGTYNADSGDYINSVPCKFLVGIGTADNNRKNGLAVLGSGVVLAPESPNSIASASAASGNTAEKMLVTYAMLQDYAPKTPGAIGKPAQTIVTLAAADWSSLEQTIDISDMTASAVVLTEPSGNPHMYYANDVYLSSQADGHLTFGCTSAPSGDVSVKVVYWP